MSQHSSRSSALRSWLKATTALAGALPMLGLTISLAHANPQGGVVTQGAATITQPDAKTVQVNQSSNRAVIDWRSFSIAADETTRFVQPSSSAIALNRVTGDQVSQILGKLQANGQIILVNPNGIVFGADSKIDVAALVASTANIKNENFMAGNLRFDIPGKVNAQIINQGTITAADGGLVALVSPSLRNSGIISARLGKVALAAANGVTLDLYGDNLILFQASDKITSQVVGTDGQPVSSLIENTGKIYADGGRVLMTANAAKGVVDNAINTTGLISARAVEQQGGEIVLKGEDAGVVQVSGTLDASGKGAGQKGGTVNVLGDVVALQSTAKVDVSGDTGGGTALIGGDYLGGGTVRNADVAYMAKGAVIDASAITTGNGGKSILWANNTTRSYGSIFARGGRLGGDGGFVETSGKVFLAQEGTVDASAPKGKAGTWLMDPGTIYIEDSTAESNTTNAGCVECSGTYLYRASTSGPAYILSSTISTALTSGNNVWIMTGTTDATSDIYVNGNVYANNTNGDVALYLKSARNIYITNGRIYSTNAFNGTNDFDVHIDSGLATGGGSVYIGNSTKTQPTIDVTNNVYIEGGILIQISTINSTDKYTIQSGRRVTLAKNADPNATTNSDEISLGDRSIKAENYASNSDDKGNVYLYSDLLTLPNQGNSVAEIAYNGTYYAAATNYNFIERTVLTNSSSTASTTSTQQQTETTNVNSNNRERRNTNGLTEIAKNVDGSDLGQLAHNVVALYLQSINFDSASNRGNMDYSDQVRAFSVLRDLVYDNLNHTSIPGKGYGELLSLIMSGDVKPDMSNQLWRALMNGDQLSPAQQYALNAYNAIREGMNQLAIDPHAVDNDYSQSDTSGGGASRTISFGAYQPLEMKVASAIYSASAQTNANATPHKNAVGVLVSKISEIPTNNIEAVLTGEINTSGRNATQTIALLNSLSNSKALTTEQRQIVASLKAGVDQKTGKISNKNRTTYSKIDTAPPSQKQSPHFPNVNLELFKDIADASTPTGALLSVNRAFGSFVTDASSALLGNPIDMAKKQNDITSIIVGSNTAFSKNLDFRGNANNPTPLTKMVETTLELNPALSVAQSLSAIGKVSSSIDLGFQFVDATKTLLKDLPEQVVSIASNIKGLSNEMKNIKLVSQLLENTIQNTNLKSASSIDKLNARIDLYNGLLSTAKTKATIEAINGIIGSLKAAKTMKEGSDNVIESIDKATTVLLGSYQATALSETMMDDSKNRMFIQDTLLQEAARRQNISFDRYVKENPGVVVYTGKTIWVDSSIPGFKTPAPETSTLSWVYNTNFTSSNY
jgi:filamentous hemagglutinin family protein